MKDKNTNIFSDDESIMKRMTTLISSEETESIEKLFQHYLLLTRRNARDMDDTEILELKVIFMTGVGLTTQALLKIMEKDGVGYSAHVMREMKDQVNDFLKNTFYKKIS